MASKVHPFVLAQLIGDAGNVRIPSFNAREHRDALDVPSDICQFSMGAMELVETGGICLTNCNETLLYRLDV